MTDKNDDAKTPASRPAKGKGKERLIKYMGSADVRLINRDEDVMGTLPPLPYPLRWKQSNNWTLDASKFPEVDSVWWDHLCANDNFKDVTDAKVKPLNEHQRTFLGMQGAPVYDEKLDALSHAPTGAPAS